MNKEALEYMYNLGQQGEVATEINGDTYLVSKGKVCCSLSTFRADEDYDHDRVGYESVQMRSLQSLVDFIIDDPQCMMGNIKPWIHVYSADTVYLLTELDVRGNGNTIATVTPILPELRIDQGQDIEAMLVDLLANFAETEDQQKLLSVLSNISLEDNKEIKDNGIVQEIKVKKGVDIKSVGIQNPVVLAPFRTFIEVEQPRSNYIFRLKRHDRSESLVAGLFTAGGDAWQIKAMANIKQYLAEKLPDMVII